MLIISTASVDNRYASAGNATYDVGYHYDYNTAYLHFRYQIRPRYVRDTSDFNMKMQLLGEAIDFPIGIAPTGGKRLLHWEGEIATARGQ